MLMSCVEFGGSMTCRCHCLLQCNSAVSFIDCFGELSKLSRITSNKCFALCGWELIPINFVHRYISSMFARLYCCKFCLYVSYTMAIANETCVSFCTFWPPWVRPWDNRRKYYMDGKRIQCWTNALQHNPSIFNRLRAIARYWLEIAGKRLDLN